MLNSLLAGLLTGLGLIIAIGAQNAFVLRQGITRSHVGAVVAVCAASDLVLIAAGVGGVGLLVDRSGWVLEVIRWCGVAFLAWYGASALRRAFRPEALHSGAASSPDSVRRVTARAAALTWLNPHVYLDTVILLGAVAATQGAGAGDGSRWWFAVGAGWASIAWFCSLGYGARLLAPLFARPRAWQVLEVLVGVTMFSVAAGLALH
ncbi:MAG TPA: LysE/ArgO family amino acid transporter [Marmoricola sp.]|nr:LysE/ArgO family amino acid transporter [Marmoricola sp.]